MSQSNVNYNNMIRDRLRLIKRPNVNNNVAVDVITWMRFGAS